MDFEGRSVNEALHTEFMNKTAGRYTTVDFLRQGAKWHEIECQKLRIDTLRTCKGRFGIYNLV